MKGLTVLFFGGIVSCGCTSMRSPPPPGPDHPASADAASSPMPSPSQTLAQRDAVAVPPDGASSTPMRMTDGATSGHGHVGARHAIADDRRHAVGRGLDIRLSDAAGGHVGRPGQVLEVRHEARQERNGRQRCPVNRSFLCSLSSIALVGGCATVRPRASFPAVASRRRRGQRLSRPLERRRRRRSRHRDAGSGPAGRAARRRRGRSGRVAEQPSPPGDVRKSRRRASRPRRGGAAD